jgi:hypothetical protein
VPEVDPQTGQPKMQPVAGPDGQPQVDPNTGQPQMAPVQKINNRIAEMDMDIIIDTAPDTANLEQEIWHELLELSKTVPIGTPQFMIALEMSPLPDKQRIIDRIKAWQKEQQQQPDPMQIQQQQTELAGQAAEVANKQADTEVKLSTVAKTYFEMGVASVHQLPADVQDQGDNLAAHLAPLTGQAPQPGPMQQQ